jgi:ferredoxin
MGCTIYYFSATGNSLQVARQMANKLGNCTIKSIATQPPNQPVGGPTEAVGFIFPVYYFGMPRLVKRFVEKLQIKQGTYCFAFTTFGGSQLDTIGMLNDVLLKKNIQLAYGDGAAMPDTYIVRYDAVPPDEAQRMLEAATEKVDETAKAIKERKVQPVKRKAKLLGKIANRLTLYRNIAGYDEKFEAKSNCVSCGLCSEICPAGNIKMEDHYPVWQHHCERCLACLQWCPTEAIQYGKKTIKRTRYHNPNVKVGDIVQGNKSIV